jgi:hypothetical protein
LSVEDTIKIKNILSEGHATEKDILSVEDIIKIEKHSQ